MKSTENKTEFTEKDKTILTGRIYPTIQSCVNNRYKIVVGYFAICGFLVISKDRLKEFVDIGAASFLAIIFTIFVIHNSVNYWLNSKEQSNLEQLDQKFEIVEVVSSIVIIIIIWIGYCFLRTQANSA